MTIKSRLITLCLSAALFLVASAAFASNWSWMTSPAPFFPDNMLLMTDGTVLITDRDSTSTATLTPDVGGFYLTGTWALGPSMHNNHLFNSSAVLRDGSTIICGGEYLDGVLSNSNLCERLPLLRSFGWSQVTPPGGVPNIGDMASAVLPDGNFFLFGWSDPSGSPITPSQIFNPSTGTWTASGTSLYNDRENGLALTQDGTLLTVQSWVIGGTPSTAAEKYVASSGAWVATPNLPNSLGDGVIGEMGPDIGLLDGRVFVVGENGQTALYTPDVVDSGPGSWASGPVMPVINGIQTGSPDASAVVLPSGQVLFVGMPLIIGSWTPPYWFLFDPILNTITQDTTAPSDHFVGSDGSNAIMLLLPSGQVLVFVNDTTMLLYTPDGPAAVAAKPVLTSFPTNVQANGLYGFNGIGLHGLSQGCAYNDEFQSATNYPIVELKNTLTGAAVFAQTRGFSTMATTPGLSSHAVMRIPAGTPRGIYTATVIVNGVSSDTLPVTVF